MKKPAQADLQRWSEEVARDATSLAFLPLARAYRRQGQRAAAKQLCLRGLEHYPTHAEAHSLLALLYLEDGERAKAADEWSMVLRMDPNHFDALRGIGFCYLEQDQLSLARQALERAALLRPQDAAVEEALKVLGTRQELHSGGTRTNAWSDDLKSARTDREGDDIAHSAAVGVRADSSADTVADAGAYEPWAESPSTVAPEAPVISAPPVMAAPTPPAVRPAQQPLSSDPSEIFAALMTGGPLLGVLLLDGQGLVMAGSLGDGSAGSAELLGATLGPAISEAARTVSLLSLGGWRGMLLEAGTAVLHVSPVRDDAVVLLAARRNAPTGWVLRTAGQASEIAVRYLEEYA